MGIVRNQWRWLKADFGRLVCLFHSALNQVALLAAFTLSQGLCCAETDPDWIALLHAPDIKVRRDAVDQIQTRDDQRIPEACLSLLRDEGNSIRRQAARAIGSRFYQISNERRDTFLEALRECAKQGPSDVALLANRAIGLIARDFSSPAFSTSPDGRWVLYEQRRLPMIADCGLKHRQLLAPTTPDLEAFRSDSYVRGGNIVDIPGRKTRLLKLMTTNEPAGELFHPSWHPKGDALAFTPVIQSKFYEPVCIWRVSDGAVRVWSPESFKRLYGKRFPHWGTTSEFVKWDGRKAVIHIYDCDNAGYGEPYDPKGLLVSVNIDDWSIAVVK